MRSRSPGHPAGVSKSRACKNVGALLTVNLFVSFASVRMVAMLDFESRGYLSKIYFVRVRSSQRNFHPIVWRLDVEPRESRQNALTHQQSRARGSAR